MPYHIVNFSSFKYIAWPKQHECRTYFTAQCCAYDENRSFIPSLFSA